MIDKITENATVEVSETLISKLMMTVKEVTQKLGIKSYKTIINTGAEAGQTVFHLHIHILAGEIRL